MPSRTERLANEVRYSVTAAVGSAQIECFAAQRAFRSDRGQNANSLFTEEHMHASYELLYCKSGSGMQFVKNSGHGYDSHSVFLFAPFVRHAHISDERKTEVRYSIRFALARAQAEHNPYVLTAFQYLKEKGYHHFVADDTVQYLIEKIAAVITEGPSCTDLLLSGLFSALFSYVLRSVYFAKNGQKEGAPVALLEDSVNSRKFLIDFFFDHLMDGDARMEDLCRQVHLSPSQLNRVIKETFGTTFKQKLIEVRLCYAKYFLKFSNLSISEIAQRTNFSEDSNFSLFFKQHCGMSPTQFRRTEREAFLQQQSSDPKHSGR